MRLALLCAACLLPGSPALPLGPGPAGEGDPRWQLAQVRLWPALPGRHGLSRQAVLCHFNNFPDYKGSICSTQVAIKCRL